MGGNCSRRTLRLCHLAALDHCLLRLTMDAGSSCFCLLCHPSAKACQFHYHASVTRMRRRPGMPKAERQCIYVRARLWITKHNGSAAGLVNKRCPFGLRLLQTQRNYHACADVKKACTFTGIHPDPRSVLHTHALTQTFVFTESLLMMGGSMMFVCVPKELALPLGPNQQPTAAGY